jgi:hypothetical protein
MFREAVRDSSQEGERLPQDLGWGQLEGAIRRAVHFPVARPGFMSAARQGHEFFAPSAVSRAF